MIISPSGIFGFIAIAFFIFQAPLSFAMVKGPCSNCHTMHNSQNGAAMTYDGSNEPNSHLLRTSGCVGCHAQGGASNIIVDSSGNGIPQVIHTDGSDLASGNFSYLSESQNNGHNVVDLASQDTIHLYPPGGPLKNAGAGIQHPDTMPERFTCAGLYGCHGNSHIIDPMASMQGAHHTIADKTFGGFEKPTGTTVGNSFRFLLGVEGLEMADWQNTDKDHHNEYKIDGHQATSPWVHGCGWCHGPDNQSNGTSDTGVLAPGSGMQYLCMRCHPVFHSAYDLGGDRFVSPWFRHPSNLVIPNTGEYQYYTEYSIDAPVTRKIIPDSPSSVVTPGIKLHNVGNDYVSCISCHKAHATDHGDILRWDYANIKAGDSASSGKGCIICHTSKDD